MHALWFCYEHWEEVLVVKIIVVAVAVAIVECVACVGHQWYRLCRAPGAPTSRASGALCRYSYELMVQLWIFTYALALSHVYISLVVSTDRESIKSLLQF